MKQIIFVEDGSVDACALQVYVGGDAYVCVVRQGAQFPVYMFLSLEQNELNEEPMVVEKKNETQK